MAFETVEHFASCRSLGQAWGTCLNAVVHEGCWVHDADERLLEICPMFVRIEAVDENDPLIREFADQSRISLMKKKYSFCGILPEYKISYGKLLYENDGVNQVDWVIERLRSKRETKSATIGFHRPGEEVLSCLSLLDFKIRHELLCVTAIYRSQNVFASQPGNVVAINSIQKTVAAALACDLGPLDLYVASAHIYERDLEAATSVVKSLSDRNVSLAPSHAVVDS